MSITGDHYRCAGDCNPTNPGDIRAGLICVANANGVRLAANPEVADIDIVAAAEI